LLNSWLKFFFIFLVLHDLHASRKEDKDFDSIKRRYLKELESYHRELCPQGTEDQYLGLLKDYRGLGYYLPEVGGEVDLVTIEKLLPEILKKIEWLEKVQGKLSVQSWPDSQKIGDKILALIQEALKFKEEYAIHKDFKAQKKIAGQSMKVIGHLKAEVKKLFDELYFLQSYDFPVDHLKNRKIYDDFKDFEDHTSKQISNYAFFYRKILEDGAYNPDQTGYDLFLRSTMDTIWFEVHRPQLFLDEDLRVDLEWAIKKIRKEIDRGHTQWKDRINEWLGRLQRQRDFYKDLINPDNRARTQEIVQTQNQALLKLKDFVIKNQTKSYLFWTKRTSDLQALFVLDTILHNEVGDVDAPDALERMDVAQIVWNRQKVAPYAELKSDQMLYKELVSQYSDEKIKGHTWLNSLFRLGEFSFTYPYIPGVVKIFCFDQSKKGKKLQKENLKIGWTTIQKPREEFTPIRYFSRAAMLGRINMGLVWDQFKLYPERAGLLAEGQPELLSHFTAKQYRFLYAFSDPEAVEYWVIDMKNKIYVVRPQGEKSLFFSYRNPQDFRYFTPK
jgi:hypothetical protein